MADPLLLADMSGMNARFRLEEAIRCGDANAVKRFFSAVPGARMTAGGIAVCWISRPVRADPPHGGCRAPAA